MAKFKEYTQFQGVTEPDAGHPKAGIIVPMGPGPGKFNLVRLAGGRGIRLQPPPSAPTIKIEDVTDAGNFLGAAALHSPLSPGDKLFKISGSLPLTTQVQAGGDTLQIAVVKQRTVKLSIRPVMVRNPLNPQLPPIPHTSVGGDINAMVAQMNDIWTPQANVVFTLTSSTPVQLTDETRIAKIMGVSTPTHALPDEVNIDVFNDLLNENKDNNADLTMFFVASCSEGPVLNVTHAEGVTDFISGISLISDRRAQFPAIMAHEAGHFLLELFEHTDKPHTDINGHKVGPDKRKQLMIEAGGSFAYTKFGSILVPFDLAIQIRRPS